MSVSAASPPSWAEPVTSRALLDHIGPRPSATSAPSTSPSARTSPPSRRTPRPRAARVPRRGPSRRRWENFLARCGLGGPHGWGMRKSSGRAWLRTNWPDLHHRYGAVAAIRTRISSRSSRGMSCVSLALVVSHSVHPSPLTNGSSNWRVSRLALLMLLSGTQAEERNLMAVHEREMVCEYPRRGDPYEDHPLGEVHRFCTGCLPGGANVQVYTHRRAPARSSSSRGAHRPRGRDRVSASGSLLSGKHWTWLCEHFISKSRDRPR